MKYIQYKTSKRQPSMTMQREGALKLEEPANPMGLINGMTPGSAYEWNMARALWQLGWTFDYQVPIHGGRQVRGGQVLDFLVNTAPQSTVIRVQGDYWHRSSALEELKADDIARYLGEPVTVLDAWNKDTDTYDAAYAWAYAKLGRG